MALTYLSGVSQKRNMQVGRARKKKTKAEKKAKRQGRRKKVVKFALGPTRGAFLTIVTLNLFKTATRMAKAWQKPQGKADIISMWESKFKGDISKLKTAISKGAKTSISGEDSIGVAPEILMASAVPIILALIPILKRTNTGESITDLEGALAEGKEELNLNPDKYGDVKAGGGELDPDETKGSFFSAFGMCFWGTAQLGMIQQGITNPILFLISTIFATYFFFGLPLGVIYQSNHRFKKYISWYFDYPMNFIKNIFSYGKRIIIKKG